MPVTYLVSSYNKAEYLNAVLESITHELNDTGGEVFIIDDGSKDRSWALIEEFGRSDPRITVRRQANQGIFNVTNKLIRSGSNTWLRIVDCDDPPIAGSTRLLMETAEKLGAGYIFGSTAPYGPEPLSAEGLRSRQQLPTKVEQLEDPMRYAIREYNHVPTTALIRRDCIPPNVRLNENFISCQDLALALPVFENARVVRIDVPVCNQLIGVQKRLSSNEALTYFQTIQIIKDFGATKFDGRYKYMSARKLVSRAMRWMRRNKMIATAPIMYSKLLFLYGCLHVTRSIPWERYLDTAAQPYRRFIPADSKIY